MRNLIKEPTDQKLTPYLFENGASYRSYAILAPNLTIARDHNKTSRLGGKYVGIDNRLPPINLLRILRHLTDVIRRRIVYTDVIRNKNKSGD